MLYLEAISAFGQALAPVTFVGNPHLGTGVHFWQGWDYHELLPIIEKSGLGWVRDEIGWEQTEKEKGVYGISEDTMAWIHAVHAHHLRLLLILNSNGGNPIYDDHFDSAAYARWAAWTVAQLKGDIDAVEILNEPDNFGFMKFYGGTADGEGNSPWVAKFVSFTNHAAEAIKAANPALPVIGYEDMPVTYKIMTLGMTAAVDGMVDHPYSNNLVPETVPEPPTAEQMKIHGFIYTDDKRTFASYIQGMRKRSAEYHGPKQIWLTEWGYSTFQPIRKIEFGGFTEDAQAKYIVRHYVEDLGLGVDVSVQYDFHDDGEDPHNVEDHFGMVHQDGAPKPSYGAVQNMTRVFAPYRRAQDGEVGEVKITPAVCWAEQAPIAEYRFVSAQGQPAVAIWGTDRADGDLQPRVADLELEWGTGIKRIVAVDTLTGHADSLAFMQEGDRLILKTVTILDHPVLIEAVN
jgi:hypothetical protein